MELPECSEEQLDIIHQLNNHNVVVDSVAGSGKTTCALHIAREFSKSSILLLTYNAKLKIETRNKTKELEIDNLEVHSYHSFGVKYYDRKCFTDTQIIKILKKKTEPLKVFGYDIVILDEAQDVTPLYFELVCKIFMENKNMAKICVVGDRNQSIYDFNDADERFIVYADQLFNYNKLQWKKCKLPQSFRATHETCAFINNCMLTHDRLKSKKISGNKPRYVVCDCFGGKLGTSNRPFKEVQYYLSLGYKPEDFFILAPSVKSEKSPIRQLGNKIKETLKDVQIYVPVSDEEKIDYEILKNKMVFSTFHQVKGQERKVVIVFNFDDSYFKFYKKDCSDQICANELYVATTRAIDRLTVFHHYQNNFLPFLVKDNLEIFADTEYEKLKIFKPNTNKRIKTLVTDVVRHLPQYILDECVNYLKITKVKGRKEMVNIPIKTEQKNGFESVGEITNMAIVSNFEYKIKKRMTIYDRMMATINNPGNVIVSDAESGSEEESEYQLEKIDIAKLKCDELLYIANRWGAVTSGYIYKIYQITNYDWLSEENLKRCMKRMKRLKISADAKLEIGYIEQGREELLNRILVGYIDCIDGNNMYEFKCAEQIEMEHYVQLAIYMYLNELKKMKEIAFGDIVRTNYYIYNILTDELDLVECDLISLIDMIGFLIYNKYVNVGKSNDDEFIAFVHGLSKKYFEENDVMKMKNVLFNYNETNKKFKRTHIEYKKIFY